MYKNFYKDENEFNEMLKKRKRMNIMFKVIRIILTPIFFPVAIVIGIYKFTWKTMSGE